MDWSLTVGNLLTIVLILGGGASSYYGLKSKIDNLEQLLKFRVERLEKDVDELWQQLREGAK